MTTVSQAVAGTPAERPAWPVAFLILSGSAPVNFALGLPRPVLGEMAKVLGRGPADDLLVKMIISIIGLAVVVGAPLSAWLLKKLGYRVTITTALVTMVAMGCLPYFLNDLRYIVAGRFLLGMSVAALQVSAVTLIGEVYAPDDRARMVGMMMAGAAGAALMLGPIAGWAGGFGWRVPFLLHLLFVPSILFAATCLPRGGLGAVEADQPAQGARSLRGFPFVLAGIALIAGASMILPPLYLAFRLRDIGIASPMLIGASYIAINVPELIMASMYGRVRKRFSAAALCVVGFVVTAAGLALTAVIPAYYAVLMGMMVFGVGIAIVYSSVMERASADVQNRSRAVGVVISAIFLSLVVGTFAFEPVYLALGAGGVLLGLSAMSVAMAAIMGANKLIRPTPLARSCRNIFPRSSGSRNDGKKHL